MKKWCQTAILQLVISDVAVLHPYFADRNFEGENVV